MAALFQLVIRSGPNTGKVYPLEAPEIIIGREASNGVAINDAEVSRKHAKLGLHGSSYVIQDLGSTNGTFVNGQRVTGTQVLNPGDTVSFGANIVLLYEATMDPNATMISSAQISRTVAQVNRPSPVPTPSPVPAPAPVPFPVPAAVPVYSGQVPAGPIPMTAAAKKKPGIGLVIGIVVILIILMCICISLFAFFAPQSVLCAPGIQIITNFIGPLFGYGMCP
jgi:pSer/pThr/pTyr-binding forkhead associated (FHA) protein